MLMLLLQLRFRKILGDKLFWLIDVGVDEVREAKPLSFGEEIMLDD